MVSRTKRVAARKGAALLHLVASPTRILILGFLAARKNAYVGEIAKHLGMTQSAVSHQLGLLAGSSVVVFKREGRMARYAMARTPAAQLVSRALKTLV